MGAIAPTADVGADRAPPWTLYPLRRRLLFLAVLSLVATSNFIDRNVLGILLEPIKREFKVSDAQLGLLSGFCFAVFYATLGLPIARWAERGNRVRIINLALIVWTAMTILCGFAQNFVQLALARIGVGAGEAGAVPPAQSLLADYFPPHRRASALAIYTLASTVGYLAAFSGGGWIAQTYGWRATLWAVALPGVPLALLVQLVLREPRGERVATAAAPVPMREPIRRTIEALLAKPGFLLVLASQVLYYFLAYGALIFTAPFIVRVHHASLAATGAAFGIVASAGAVVGTIIGGGLGDRLMASDPRRVCRLCAAGVFAAWPLHLVAFLTGDLRVLYGCIFAAVILLSAAVPGQATLFHLLCGSRRRATAVSLSMLVSNLLGMGLGPLVTGALSDAFARSVGPNDGLRYALIVILALFIPSGVCLLAAQRYIARDTEA